MSRPWQVWSLFAACVLLVIGGMSWLSMKAVELERQQRLMALRADFEGDVRLALRRMDLELAEMFAQETSWPHFAYQSFYLPDTLQAGDPFGPPTGADQPAPGQPSKVKTGGKSQTAPPALQPVASPLLVPNNYFVQLYFQVDTANKVISPNCPPAEQNDLALRNGMTPELIKKYESSLSDFQLMCNSNSLATLVPDVPSIATPAGQTTLLAVATAGNDLPPQQQAQIDSPLLPDLPQATAIDIQPAVQSPQGKQSAYAQRISPAEQARRGSQEYRTRKRQLDKIVTNWNVTLQQREQLLNQAAIESKAKAFMAGSAVNGAAAVQGASRALWIDSQLVLARRVLVDGEPVIQGCWLNWNAIKSHLAAEVADLIPNLEIVPVDGENEADLTRMLATLPAQLIVAVPTLANTAGQPPSPMMLSLVAAWVCMALAAIAAAVLLAGVMALSERRAAFVSAVTHELRTPLTTFRMYAEMLAEGMVPEAARRQQYLDTLKTESDRLFHLVENVLSYARLERGKRAGTVSQVSVQQLVAGMQHGLAQRAGQADMQLLVDVQPQAADRILKTDVGAVEQVMINLVDNACKYAVSGDDRRIHLDAEAADGHVLLQVRDHGPGIAPQEMRRLFRPFTKSAREAAHSAPGVGLGLALCRRLARQLGGRFYLENSESGGAKFVLKLPARTA